MVIPLEQNIQLCRVILCWVNQIASATAQTPLNSSAYPSSVFKLFWHIYMCSGLLPATHSALWCNLFVCNHLHVSSITCRLIYFSWFFSVFQRLKWHCLRWLFIRHTVMTKFTILLFYWIRVLCNQLFLRKRIDLLPEHVHSGNTKNIILLKYGDLSGSK